MEQPLRNGIVGAYLVVLNTTREGNDLRNRLPPSAWIRALTSIHRRPRVPLCGIGMLPSCCAKITLEAGPATETPAMSMLAVSAITGVTFFADELHQRLATQPIRQRPGLRLVQPHEGCVNDETRLHSKVQGKLHRFNCVISTIR